MINLYRSKNCQWQIFFFANGKKNWSCFKDKFLGLKMIIMTCEYCNKTVDKSNLSRHHKTKSCLKSRNGIEPKLIEDRFQCEYCQKFLCRGNYLKIHLDGCVKRYKRLLEEKDSEIEYLKQSKDSEIEYLKQSKDSEIEYLKQSKDSEIESLKNENTELKN